MITSSENSDVEAKYPSFAELAVTTFTTLFVPNICGTSNTITNLVIVINRFIVSEKKFKLEDSTVLL